MKIGFLFDIKNNWLEKFIDLNDFKKKTGHIFSKAYDIKNFKNLDIIFILGYLSIIKEEDLKRNKKNLVVHESALPRNRGFNPIQHQILKGKNEITICLIEASPKVDQGQIFFSSKIVFNGTELYDEIRLKQARATQKIIKDYLKSYPNKGFQQSGIPTFNKKLTELDNKLDINKSLSSQFNKLRIGNNEEWPSNFEYKKTKYIIKIYKKKKKN